MNNRYVLVGASGRALYMFAKPMAEQMQEYAQIVGVYDPNPLRSEALKRASGLDCPVYTDCDKMLSEQQPDRAIVTTVDCTHSEFVVKCLENGIETITEKPMAMSADQCQDILDAEKRTGTNVIVTFNLRYSPFLSSIKSVVNAGTIGKVLGVNFEYLLDTSHGADYFRRWHRIKENSGGLLVHKSTHHFDLINWLIGEEPVEVMAFGTKRFYGHTRDMRGQRCLSCRWKNSCEFYFDINGPSIVGGIEDFNKTMYSDCEAADGYYRDRCVFADEIDIEDTMSVNVRYSAGVLLNYMLIAHSPYEGYRISISGANGRLEAEEFTSGLISEQQPYQRFVIYDRDGSITTRVAQKPVGDHGGADELLRRSLFTGEASDMMQRQAGAYEAALSVLIGIAANHSISQHRNILIQELLPLHLYKPTSDSSMHAQFSKCVDTCSR